MKPSSIISAVKHLIAIQQPCFIWGPPGAGKSDVMRQIAAEMEYELRDTRLSLMDPVDMKGFPVVNKELNVMEWVPPNFLPPMHVKKGNKVVANESYGVLFLDEMNTALQATQAGGYQLTLDRRIGDYVLPKNWTIVAAGNRATDRGVVHAQPAPLANRFVHLDFDVNMDDWYDWATKHDISPMLRAFMRFRPNLLHAFDATQNPRAFPTPRTWAFVDRIYDSKLDPLVEFELIKGTVGDGAAAEFQSFVKLAKDLPSIDQILIAPERTDLPSSPAAMYAICTALDKKTTPQNVDRVLKYVTRMTTEYQVLFLRSTLLAKPDVAQTTAFTKWVAENQAVLM
ncbi:ATP-binding protein [Variovorax sp. J22R133]|uniref:ATP-binding protein n=1 Tax=Variovorax brevis TaxID=3053503 RepID=UPI002577AA0D|nr:ATP-binding protein [Variovorax sp. J22R133]MDM0116893.1 ATP-binding protein [Variovorax sp. J22R133]